MLASRQPGTLEVRLDQLKLVTADGAPVPAPAVPPVVVQVDPAVGGPTFCAPPAGAQPAPSAKSPAASTGSRDLTAVLVCFETKMIGPRKVARIRRHT